MVMQQEKRKTPVKTTNMLLDLGPDSRCRLYNKFNGRPGDTRIYRHLTLPRTPLRTFSQKTMALEDCNTRKTTGTTRGGI